MLELLKAQIEALSVRIGVKRGRVVLSTVDDFAADDRDFASAVYYSKVQRHGGYR